MPVIVIPVRPSDVARVAWILVVVVLGMFLVSAIGYVTVLVLRFLGWQP